MAGAGGLVVEAATVGVSVSSGGDWSWDEVDADAGGEDFSPCDSLEARC